MIALVGWKESEIIEMYGGGFPADLAGFWVRRKLTDAGALHILSFMARNVR